MMETNKIYVGNSLEVLKTFPDESIDCVMTSPPYWALRDYRIEGQLGLERTYTEYITNLCNIFDEIKRVLRKTGTCWVNIGDTYVGGGNTNDRFQKQGEGKSVGDYKFDTKANKLPEKCLVQIPHRFAIEMVNRGWTLRNTIIWHKGNIMPSSVKDRFTIDFEYLFFFTKQSKYYFDTQYEPLSEVTIEDYKSRQNMALLTGEHDSKHFENPDSPYSRQKGCIRCGDSEIPKTRMDYLSSVPLDASEVEYRDLPDINEFAEFLNELRRAANLTIDEIEERMGTFAARRWFNAETFPSKDEYIKLKDILNLPDRYYEQLTTILHKPQDQKAQEYGRIKRTVWHINTKPFSEEHFATYPEELVETPLKAGCPEFVCNRCGKPREKIFEVDRSECEIKEFKDSVNMPEGEYKESTGFTRTVSDIFKYASGRKIIMKGWSDCQCNAGFSPGIMLDPFSGSGTTSVVAKKFNRRYIGIELNPKYAEMSEDRLLNVGREDIQSLKEFRKAKREHIPLTKFVSDAV